MFAQELSVYLHACVHVKENKREQETIYITAGESLGLSNEDN